MAYPGPIDVVYDTVGKPETFEVGVRVLAARGTLVKAGVHAPGRWEWSPLYFKEINWVGSNAFGVEEVEGRRKHAIEHYLDLVVDGRVDLRPMLTHTFRLDRSGAMRSLRSRTRAERSPTSADRQPAHRERRIALNVGELEHVSAPAWTRATSGSGAGSRIRRRSSC